MYILSCVSRYSNNESAAIGGMVMPKDSQVDNKKARMEKANGQIPITRENQNNTKNVKKQSAKHNDV